MMGTRTVSWSLETFADLELYNVRVEQVTYDGRKALRLVEERLGEGGIAVLPGSDFRDGVIEAEVVGDLRSDAPQDMRGFVGIAFRVQSGGSPFECFFVRPTNARADDQLRRNHSTQYYAEPEYPWYRLREEAPGVYESYTDLVPGAWTHLKIVVSGVKAQLYVNGAQQPCLVVNDLKLRDREGKIALWIGAGTQAHFSVVTASAA
jgi:hypothetical protein